MNAARKQEKEMTWFAVVLDFYSTMNGKQTLEGLCELSVRLVRASSAEEAGRIGMAIGEASQHGYEGLTGEEVFWHFNGVSEIQEVTDDPFSGDAEVFSRLHYGSESRPDSEAQP